MYSTFLAPTETPITSLAIKRALLTFDKVYISDPSDRDFFPPQAFTVALGMPPIFGFNGGAIRPLGKLHGYDNDFDRVMEEVEYARREGLIDVISTYDLSTSDQFTLGAVPTGDYPLNTRFLLSAYRNIARDNKILLSAITSDHKLLEATDETLAALGELRGRADGGINDDPPMPAIQGEFEREHLRDVFSTIARARVASVMKSVGYCTAKQMIPTFSDASYVNIVGHMTSRANAIIDKVGEFDPHWSLRSKVLNIAHDEYVDDKVLAKLTIDDVLKLRTRAWGRQGEARDQLLQSAALLARECETAPEFDKEVRRKIEEYRLTHGEIISERSQLNFKISCDLMQATGGVGAAALSGSLLGTLSQEQAGVGAGTVLLAGCLYAIEKIKDYKPVIEQVRLIEREFADNICFGMHNFYRKLS